MSKQEMWTFGFRITMLNGESSVEVITVPLGHIAAAYRILTVRMTDKNKTDSAYLISVKSIERVR
jgi:hypothetical protein